MQSFTHSELLNNRIESNEATYYLDGDTRPLYDPPITFILEKYHPSPFPYKNMETLKFAQFDHLQKVCCKNNSIQPNLTMI